MHARCLSSALVLFACLALAGCAVSRDPGYVAREWEDSMRELSIYPLFPPREDVQVGDVYVLQAADGQVPEDGFTTPGVWFDSILPTAEVTAFYQARANFPKGFPLRLDADGNPLAAGANPDTAAGYAQVTSPLAPPDVFHDEDPLGRLRLVQFPGFNLALMRNGDLGFAGFGVLGRLFGAFGGSDETTLAVSVPQAESYALTANRMIDLLQARCAAGGKVLDPARAELAALPQAGKKRSAPVLVVINEVFYTRSLDFTYSNGSGFGADVQASMAAAQEDEATAPAAPTGATAATGDQDDAAGQLADLRTRVDAMSQQFAGKAVPGARAGITLVGDHSIRLSQEFERPIAIGYRALFLRPLGNCAVAGIPVR
ncbi:MAG TPA: hypothetical protein VK943_13760 [Arenibaculum sp.]|nr:hypothetical protein [Arenibaculum sp.]